MIKYFMRLINFLLIRIYSNQTIILYKLDKLVPHSSSARVSNVNVNNILDILSFQDESYIKIFTNFLDLKDTGYYAYLDQRCVHRTWVKSKEQIIYIHKFYKYKLKRNEIFIHYCETDNRIRGKGIYPHVLTEIIKNNTKKDILISVTKNNIPSIKGIEKVGFKELKRIKIIVFFGIRRVIINKKEQNKTK